MWQHSGHQDLITFPLYIKQRSEQLLPACSVISWHPFITPRGTATRLWWKTPGHRKAACTESRWWQHVKWGLVPRAFISSPSGQYGEKTLPPPPLTEGAPWWRCICQTHCAGPWRNIQFLPQRSYTARTNIIILQPKAISSFWPKHTKTTPQQDQERKLLFWHQTVLCSCTQVGRYTQPVIFYST